MRFLPPTTSSASLKIFCWDVTPTGKKGSSKDLVQETFLRASRHFGEFCGSSEQEWRGWLRRSCAVACSKWYTGRWWRVSGVFCGKYPCKNLRLDPGQKRRARQAWSSVRAARPAHARRQELSSLLTERLSRLPGPYREVLILRLLEGLSFPEVADRMGRPPGAVRILWLRALERLRQQPMIEELQ